MDPETFDSFGNKLSWIQVVERLYAWGPGVLAWSRESFERAGCEELRIGSILGGRWAEDGEVLLLGHFNDSDSGAPHLDTHCIFCAPNNLLLNARAWGHSKGKQVHFLNFLACSETSIYIVPGFLDLLPLRM